MTPEVVRRIQLNLIMENPNMSKLEKIEEVHKILTKSKNELLNDYFLIVKKQMNFEETYSSLFKGRDDKNENKKSK